ncbi:lim zinc finger domain containing protein [Anaeramoeba flamelloides]|uniref:Lim zinc finger domain containing protein n=1 Tax=Anaeramoeba flamelloides TaxID=1746091 RepID=A0AAV7ZQJ6_9EUKA|nr:lim zinc finger domain containing protein [Anaeramoeba flamelloides]
MSCKCSICDDVVISDFRFFSGKKVHRTCFACTNCNKQLRLGHLIKIDEKLLCESCGNLKTGIPTKKCGTCGKLASGRMIKIAGKEFHPNCLKCETCGKQIPSNRIVNLEKLYCSSGCVKNKYSKRIFNKKLSNSQPQNSSQLSQKEKEYELRINKLEKELKELKKTDLKNTKNATSINVNTEKVDSREIDELKGQLEFEQLLEKEKIYKKLYQEESQKSLVIIKKLEFDLKVAQNLLKEKSCSSSNNEISKLNEQLKEETKLIDNYQKDIKELETKIGELISKEPQVKVVEKVVIQTKTETIVDQTKVKELENKLENLENSKILELQLKDQKIKELSKSNEELSKKYKEEQNKAPKVKVVEKVVTETKIEKVLDRSEIDKLNKKLKEENEEKDMLNEKLKACENKEKKYKNKNKHYKKLYKEEKEEKEKLQKQNPVGGGTRMNFGDKQKIKELETKLENANKQLQNTSRSRKVGGGFQFGKIQSLEKELEETKKKLSQAQSDLEQSKNFKPVLKTNTTLTNVQEGGGSSNNNDQDTKRRLLDLNRSLKLKDKKIQDLSNDKNSLESAKKDLETEVQRLKKMKLGHSAKVRSFSITTLSTSQQSTNSNKTNSIENLKKKAETFERRWRKSCDKVNSLTNEKQKVELKVKEFERKSQNLQREVSEINKKVKKLEQELRIEKSKPRGSTTTALTNTTSTNTTSTTVGGNIPPPPKIGQDVGGIPPPPNLGESNIPPPPKIGGGLPPPPKLGGPPKLSGGIGGRKGRMGNPLLDAITSFNKNGLKKSTKNVKSNQQTKKNPRSSSCVTPNIAMLAMLQLGKLKKTGTKKW